MTKHKITIEQLEDYHEFVSPIASSGYPGERKRLDSVVTYDVVKDTTVTRFRVMHNNQLVGAFKSLVKAISVYNWC